MRPIVFTSIPKCGTNLLLRYVQTVGFDRLGPFNHIEQREAADRYGFVRAIQGGQCTCWHYAWSPELSALLNRGRLRAVFLYRDPRAQVVSNLHYIMGMPEHRSHRYLAGHFTTEAQRLTCLIEGLSPEEKTEFFPGGGGDDRGKDRTLHAGTRGVRALYHRYQGWLTDPNCLCVKFEDLVGPRGGGSAGRQKSTVKHLMSFTGVPAPSVNRKTVASALFDPSVATFRNGTIDGWRKEFTAELLERFRRAFGEELSLWGYED